MTAQALSLEHIRIEFSCTEGALRRILGVVEVRGFAVRSMQMGSNADRSVATLALAPLDPFRKVEVLLRQLDRLQEIYGTIHLTNAPAVAEVPHAASA